MCAYDVYKTSAGHMRPMRSQPFVSGVGIAFVMLVLYVWSEEMGYVCI